LKKTQLELLAADQPLQFGDPSRRRAIDSLVALGLIRALQHWSRLRAPSPPRLGAMPADRIPPPVEQLAVHPQFAGQGTHHLAGRHALDVTETNLLTERPSIQRWVRILLGHQFSLRELSPIFPV
jgi:hypothetical protein